MIIVAVILFLLAAGGGLTALFAETPAGTTDPTAGDATAQSTSVVGALDNLFSGANPMSSPTLPGTASDPIWQCCYAIANAEGFTPGGSNVPSRLHNPGDISDGASTYGSEQHSGSSVTIFPDDATGWGWLYNKVSNIVNGASDVYSPDMTWTQIAQKWAGNWQAWVNNVTSYLGVSPTDRFGDFFGV